MHSALYATRLPYIFEIVEHQVRCCKAKHDYGRGTLGTIIPSTKGSFIRNGAGHPVVLSSAKTKESEPRAGISINSRNNIAWISRGAAEWHALKGFCGLIPLVTLRYAKSKLPRPVDTRLNERGKAKGTGEWACVCPLARIGSQSIYTGRILIPGLIGRSRQTCAPGKTSLMHPRCIGTGASNNVCRLRWSGCSFTFIRTAISSPDRSYRSRDELKREGQKGLSRSDKTLAKNVATRSWRSH